MNPIIYDALHAKPKVSRFGHAMWCVHDTRKFRKRSVYMHGPRDLGSKYIVVGSHCPICGLVLEERGEALLILDLMEARPATTRAALRRLKPGYVPRSDLGKKRGPNRRTSPKL